MTLHRITLQLARNPGMPQGDAGQGYTIVAPLGDGALLDVDGWRANRPACRVTRFHPDPAEEAHGWLMHRGQNWFFRYEDEDDAGDDAAFRFAAHTLREGEYVTISHEGGDPQTYKITDVSPL